MEMLDVRFGFVVAHLRLLDSGHGRMFFFETSPRNVKMNAPEVAHAARNRMSANFVAKISPPPAPGMLHDVVGNAAAWSGQPA